MQTTASGTSGPGIPNSSGNGDIFVNSAISWSSANTLTLDAYHSIAINAGITVSGGGHLVLITNHGGSGGTLTFGPSGSASFTGTRGTVALNQRQPYTLLYSMSQLDAIDSFSAVNGAIISGYGGGLGGNYALATGLDATGTTYTRALIGNNTAFTGQFDGLGHTISNLTIAPTASNISNFGLFEAIGIGGMVANLNLANVNIQANPNLGTTYQKIGTLAG